eukprot:NODE_632_length_5775_cov_0.216702.p2 type:complete len:206 gc:universal NODE_632_length_5775_cov_0.216702:1040-423(-)
MYRIDGRLPNQYRQMGIKLGMSEADGSAYFQLGSTKVMVTVTFSLETKFTANPTNNEHLKQIESMFLPWMQNPAHIDITLLQKDGSELACCVNCVSLAIADAGIVMEDLIFSLNSGIQNMHSEIPTILLDPNYMEEQSGVTVTWFISNQKILGFHVQTPVHIDSLLQNVSTIDAVNEFGKTLRTEIKKHVSKILKLRGCNDNMVL